MAAQNIQSNQVPTFDRSSTIPFVSNKLGEPMALFAVPLPSSSKSDFLCLCKRLFWNVGTSYFSAFCPLTAEETRVLPHASAVVQLVSVTPALANGDEGKLRPPQDLLAYTMWGDIVGIPYVSISLDHHPKGKLTKAFRFDDLTTSAWVPAINAPFVGAMAGVNGLGPKKDVFIIRNDEKTRESLLKGENILFSQQEGNKSVEVPPTQQRASQEVTSPTKSPHKGRAQLSKVSPTSSSLYKSYNSNRRDPETGTVCTPNADETSAIITKPTPVMSEESAEQPAMVLPRIVSVFSLANSSSSCDSLSKQTADTLARNASLQQCPALIKSSAAAFPVVRGDASTPQRNTSPSKGSINKGNTSIKAFRKPSSNGTTISSEMEKSHSNGLVGIVEPTRTARSHPVHPLETCSSETKKLSTVQLEASIVHPVTTSPVDARDDGRGQAPPSFMKSASSVKNMSNSAANRVYQQSRGRSQNQNKKVSGFTVKELLIQCGRMNSPSTHSALGRIPLGTRFNFSEQNSSVIQLASDASEKEPVMQTPCVAETVSMTTDIYVNSVQRSTVSQHTSDESNNRPVSQTPSVAESVSMTTDTCVKSRFASQHTSDASTKQPVMQTPSVSATVSMAKDVCINSAKTSSSLQHTDALDKIPVIGFKESREPSSKGCNLNVGSTGCTSRQPGTSLQEKKLPTLKMVIKTKRDSDDKVKTSCRSQDNKLVVLNGVVPCLKLQKVDVSCYSYVDPTMIVQECSSQHLDNLSSDSVFRKVAALDVAHEGTRCSNRAIAGRGDLDKLPPTLTAGVDSRQSSVSVPVAQMGILTSPTSGSDSRQKKKSKKRKKFRLSESKRSRSKPDRAKTKVLVVGLKRKRDTSLSECREHLSDCQNKLSERSQKRKAEDVSNFDFGVSGEHFQIEASNGLRSNSYEKVQDLQNPHDMAGQDVDESVLSLAREVSQDDKWSEASSRSDSEWECPDRKSNEIDSDWDSSLEDDTSSPLKCAQPVTATPFGDFQHMVLQDKLRLLEQTLKEHQTVLNAIRRPRDNLD